MFSFFLHVNGKKSSSLLLSNFQLPSGNNLSQVHHMSKIDEGFYNCSASNSEGFVTCTAEIEVIPGDGTRRLRKVPAAPSFIEVLPGKFKVNISLFEYDFEKTTIFLATLM